MPRNVQQQKFTLALVFGATMLGMVLAGGTDLVPRLSAEPAPQSASDAVIVAPQPTSLPGFADLAAAVSPAVVSIQATKIERASDRRGGQDPFGFFFGPPPRAGSP